MAKLIDGKAYAEGLRARIAAAVASLKKDHGLTPGLAVVLVGEDPASRVYVANKAKQNGRGGHELVGAQAAGRNLRGRSPRPRRQAQQGPAVHGILVQMPVPKHIDSAKVLNAIAPEKDVDGFHVVNVGRLSTGRMRLSPARPPAA